MPIHEVGEHDGQHYFSMKLIDGGSLAQAVSSGQWPLGTRESQRRSAELVARVARAVHYAHQHGILHRDLKPGNILLDAGGQPHVTDFGLAKRVHDDQGLTQSGAILGTPAYMAPEQAAGQKVLSTATDIYSLGAILYELLTGRPPFVGETPLATLLQVRERAPAAPRALNPRVDRDLETACLKCLEKEPGKRYASAEALAEDLRRWLAGEPIQARSAGRAERLWRWCRRKPALASLAAAVVLVCLLGSAGVIWQWLRAESNLQDAQGQRANAEESLRQALLAVDSFCTQVSQDVLLNEPGMQGLRKQLLETARDYYQTFVQERGDNPRLRRELARAQLRLGLLMADIDSKDKAIDLVHHALALFEQVVRDDPDVPNYLAELANCHERLGNLYRATKQLTRARTALVSALTIEQRLSGDYPQVARYRNQQALTHNEIGLLAEEERQMKQAETAFQTALGLFQTLSDADPADVDYQVNRALVCDHLGILYQTLGETERAKAALQSALAIRTHLKNAHPRVARYQDSLAASHLSLAKWYRENQKTSEAEAAIQEAIALWDRLAAESPRVTKYQDNLANGYNRLGHLYWRDGQLKKAEAPYLKGLEIQRRLARDHPKYPDFQASLSYILNNLGLIYRELRRMPEATLAHEESSTIDEQLVADYPNVTSYQVSLAQGYNNMGLVHVANGRSDLALVARRKTLEMWQRLASANPKILDYQSSLATSHYNLALSYKDNDEWKQAEGEFLEALGILKPLADAHPTMTDVVVLVGKTYSNLGHVARDNGKPQAALDSYAPALQTLTDLLKHEKRTSEARAGLRNVHWGRAQALGLLDRHQEALRDWERAQELELQIEPVLHYEKLRCLRAITLTRLGDHASAIAEAKAVADKSPVRGQNLYDSACVYAPASVAVLQDAKLSKADRGIWPRPTPPRPSSCCAGLRRPAFSTMPPGSGI